MGCLRQILESFQSLILDTFTHLFVLGMWTSLLYKAVATVGLGLLTLQLYIGVTANDKY